MRKNRCQKFYQKFYQNAKKFVLRACGKKIKSLNRADFRKLGKVGNANLRPLNQGVRGSRP